MACNCTYPVNMGPDFDGVWLTAFRCWIDEATAYSATLFVWFSAIHVTEDVNSMMLSVWSNEEYLD